MNNYTFQISISSKSSQELCRNYYLVDSGSNSYLVRCWPILGYILGMVFCGFLSIPAQQFTVIVKASASCFQLHKSVPAQNS